MATDGEMAMLEVKLSPDIGMMMVPAMESYGVVRATDVVISRRDAGGWCQQVRGTVEVAGGSHSDGLEARRVAIERVEVKLLAWSVGA